MTNLYEQIAQEEKEIMEQIKGKTEETEEVESEEKESTPEEENIEENEELETEKEVEEKVEEPEKEVEELKPDASAFAKARKEKREAEEKAREAERKALELEERLKALESKASETKEVIPDKEEDFEAYSEYVLEEERKKREALERKVEGIEKEKQLTKQEQEQQQLYSNAVKEFNEYESKFKGTVDDYDDAAIFLNDRIKSSIRILHPEATEEQVNLATANSILQMASKAVTSGYNPAEKLYHDAQKYGYSKKDSNKKTNLNTVEKNKKRSASPLEGGVSSKTNTFTKEAVANKMTLADFDKQNFTFKDLKELK